MLVDHPAEQENSTFRNENFYLMIEKEVDAPPCKGPWHPHHSFILSSGKQSTAMTPPFSVLLVDADAYRLQRHVLDVSHDPEFFVAKSCTSKRQAQAYLQRHAVDFAVINMRLPDGNGADLIRTVLRKNPQAHVLVATDISDENIVMQAITAGANGYVLFSDIPTSTVNCLRLLLSGGSPVSPVIARSVLRSLQYRSSMADVPPPESPLSRRELDVMRLVAQGIGFSEISRILAISEHTVTTHVKKIYRKLDVHSKSEAVHAAKTLRLID